LRERTKKFAIRIVKLYNSLPYKNAAQVLGKQLLRNIGRGKLSRGVQGEIEAGMDCEDWYCCRRSG